MEPTRLPNTASPRSNRFWETMRKPNITVGIIFATRAGELNHLPYDDVCGKIGIAPPNFGCFPVASTQFFSSHDCLEI
jgi:hypothetical protein